MPEPLISIVTPVFNRESLVRRVIGSTLAQSYANFEHILVDDGSVDGTVDVVRSFRDPRVRLVQHSRNLGVSPARMSGVVAARGEWIICLDSDDELLPGALDTIAAHASSAADDIHRLAFMYELTDGRTSPQPSLSGETWDYCGYLRWLSTLTGPSDFSNCIRRRTFDTLPFPSDRSFESLYHLDFAARFKTRTYPNIVARVHDDALNRTSKYTAASLLKVAADNALSQRVLLQRHGAALRDVSPTRYRAQLRTAALHNFLAGRRTQGVVYALRHLAARPTLSGFALLLAGLAGRTLTASLMVFRSRVR